MASLDRLQDRIQTKLLWAFEAMKLISSMAFLIDEVRFL